MREGGWEMVVQGCIWGWSALATAAAAIAAAATVSATAAVRMPALPFAGPLIRVSALCSPSLLSVVLHYNTYSNTKLAFGIVYEDSLFCMEIKEPAKYS